MSKGRRTIRTLCLLVTAGFALVRGDLGAQIPPFGAPGDYTADLARRRDKTLAALGNNTVLVLWSAPGRVYSADVDYPYRQESNLLYLSGIEQAETTLVLVPGARTRKALLFVRQPSPSRDLWSDHTLTPAEVTARSGIDTVFTQQGTEVFDSVMQALLSGTADPNGAGIALGEFATFSEAVRQGRARLAVLGRLTEADTDIGLGRDADTQVAWARSMEARYPGVKATSAARVLLAQRHVKTLYEQALLRRSVDISADAHVAAMRATRPGVWEYQIKATLEYGFLSRGALSWGYPPIVGSGVNATTLHYLSATRQMGAGDLLLVDAAGLYQHLTGDITRTYPVNGRFSAAQREVYDVVLQAQEAGIAAARPGRAVAEVVGVIKASIADGLTALGLVKAVAGPERDAQIDLWFPHGPIHGIGIDVHEAIETLDQGTAFVIEPGIYVRADAFDRLPRTPANAAYAEAIRPAYERYRDIGVRIEDSFIMTSSGPELLSGRAPRSRQAIEAVVGRGR